MYLWHKTSTYPRAASRYRNTAQEAAGNAVALGTPRLFEAATGQLMAVYHDRRFTVSTGPDYLKLGYGPVIPDDWVEQVEPDDPIL